MKTFDIHKKFGAKYYFLFFIGILLIADEIILLDIPILRQIIGFLFLTILPGLLILQVLKLTELDYAERFVLSVGLSLSFVIFFGLLFNFLSLSLRYKTPLATIPLLISFNIAFIVIAIIGYIINKESSFSLPNFNLTTSEKAFLIVPILFPVLSIFGMHVMNTTNNNIILMFLLFLIPVYVFFVCFFNDNFSKRLYPIVIFLISISLLLLMALRSNHIIGSDTHSEYYIFLTTLDNLYWSVWVPVGESIIAACLSISLLPTIYQSMLNSNPEYLFKVIYSVIYSIFPLVIYIISKKYVASEYAFLASCFAMFQINFLNTPSNARTSVAVLFFALAMMVLFSNNIPSLKKRIIFIVFMATCVVSHYSTTYIFLLIMVGVFLGMQMISKKYMEKRVISLVIVLLFFFIIFFWYSQVTEIIYTTGIRFVETTFNRLNELFIIESRQTDVQALFGTDIVSKGIPHKIQFVFTWLTFAFIGIGVITLIRRYKEMSFPTLNFKKIDFLKEKFEVEYFILAIACSGLLVATVALPYISLGYGIDRLYAITTTILSVFFVIGAIILSNLTYKISFFKNFSFIRKALPNRDRTGGTGVIWIGKKNTPPVRAYIIILLVLVPYFMCSTGVMYNLFGVQRQIILNSEGQIYNLLYVHDQDSYGAKWLSKYGENNLPIYTDHYYGIDIMISQGKRNMHAIKGGLFYKEKELTPGFIYSRSALSADVSLKNREGISKIIEKTNKIFDNDAVISKIETSQVVTL